MRQKLNQADKHNPVHCPVCVHHGHLTPAVWLVDDPHKKNVTLAACEEHADKVERHGINAVQPPPKGRAQPL